MLPREPRRGLVRMWVARREQVVLLRLWFMKKRWDKNIIGFYVPFCSIMPRDKDEIKDTYQLLPTVSMKQDVIKLSVGSKICFEKLPIIKIKILTGQY